MLEGQAALPLPVLRFSMCIYASSEERTGSFRQWPLQKATTMTVVPRCAVSLIGSNNAVFPSASRRLLHFWNSSGSERARGQEEEAWRFSNVFPRPHVSRTSRFLKAISRDKCHRRTIYGHSIPGL
jgi:hypothetical protein